MSPFHDTWFWVSVGLLAFLLLAAVADGLFVRWAFRRGLMPPWAARAYPQPPPPPPPPVPGLVQVAVEGQEVSLTLEGFHQTTLSVAYARKLSWQLMDAANTISPPRSKPEPPVKDERPTAWELLNKD